MALFFFPQYSLSHSRFYHGHFSFSVRTRAKSVIYWNELKIIHRSQDLKQGQMITLPSLFDQGYSSVKWNHYRALSILLMSQRTMSVVSSIAPRWGFGNKKSWLKIQNFEFKQSHFCTEPVCNPSGDAERAAQDCQRCRRQVPCKSEKAFAPFGLQKEKKGKTN